MMTRLFIGSLLVVIIAGLLGASLAPEFVSAQGEPPPPAAAEAFRGRLPRDGLFDAPRLPSAAATQDVPQAPLAPEYANWSKLAFQSARDQRDWEVYSASGDGGNQVNLSKNSAADLHPRLNRGATRIVFASKRPGNYDLYVMNADGSGLTRLTTSSADDVSPAWSHDGSRIVFQAYRNGQAEIYVMNADGSGQTRLTNHSDYDGQPVWSPDGTQIAFVRRLNGANRIWLMNADGSNPHPVSDQSYSENPAWSPDGSQIAYDADGNGDGWQEIWLMDAAGSNQHQIYDPPETYTDAWARSWSPDGRYIAFTRIAWTYYQNQWYWTTAYLDALDPKNPYNVMQLSRDGADWNPDWQPTDIQAPTSSVLPLPAQSPATLTVSWTYSETESGPADLVIQVRDGAAGVWADWVKDAYWNTSASFTGIGGHTYFFRSQARDQAGNVEPWPPDYDAVTTVEAFPPRTSIAALRPYSRNGILVQWVGSDPGNSGIAHYDLQVREGNNAWSDWRMGTAETSAAFNGQAGVTYDFRVRGTDKAQNIEAWRAVGADATTTLYTWSVSGNATDNRGAPVANMTVATGPEALQAVPSDIDGAYAAYVAHESASYTANWNKVAYGSLPGTAFPPAEDAQADVVMPPSDNVVQNWGFEDGTSAWQFGGSLNAAVVTNTSQHSGGSAAFLGSEAKPLRSVTMLAGPLRNFSPPIDSAIDSEGVIHSVWLETDGRVLYRNKPPTGSWTIPASLPGPPAHPGGSVKLAADDTGKIHAVWIAVDTLYYSEYRPGTGWSAPESIPGTTSTWTEPGLAVSSAGVVKVVCGGQGNSGVGYGDAYFTERRRDGTWAPPRNISATYGTDEQFRIVVDSAGHAHVLWRGSDTSGYADILYTAETGDGSWSPVVNLSEYDGHPGSAAMVIDSHDVVHVAWNGDGVFYRTHPASGSWSPKQLMASSEYGGVSLFADESDRIHLAWGDSATSQVHYAVGSTGVWSESESIAPATAIPSQSAPHLFVEKNHAVHLLWLQYQNLNNWSIHYSARNAAGQWMTPVDVFQNDHDTLQPELFVDPFGTPYAIWPAHLNGSYMALSAGPGPMPTAGEATLSQAIQVPGAAFAPTLSFLHRFGTEFSSDSRLDVVVDDGNSPTTVFSANAGVNTWKHAWADLTPWAGSNVTLRFRVSEPAGASHAWAYIDEVTVGSAHPDTWVHLFGRRAALPDGQLVLTIAYGNRGGVTAGVGYVTLQLPPELLFVSADPPPSATTPELRWDVGDLAAQSDTKAIHVTLQVAPSAAPGTTVLDTASIASGTAEIEQANNTAQAATFIGHLVYLPSIAR